ncbi:hypothetical protein STEG23_037269, partial [Scotinomys teguina]
IAKSLQHTLQNGFMKINLFEKTAYDAFNTESTVTLKNTNKSTLLITHIMKYLILLTETPVLTTFLEILCDIKKENIKEEYLSTDTGTNYNFPKDEMGSLQELKVDGKMDGIGVYDLKSENESMNVSQ